MKVATFLDVDGVLTVKAINLQYAQLLGVEEKLSELERLYADRKIDNDEFNKVFIPLFRNAGFSLQFARDNFDHLQMRINTDRLLAATPNTFLVTSGPSYFVDTLAERHNLRGDRILCSRYEFDNKDLLSRCVKPVTSAMKGTFVQERAAHFDVSIGVGDTEQDIEFMSHCNIRVLMGGNRLEYFTARELQPVLDVIRKLGMATGPVDRKFDVALAKLYAHSPYENNIFIMTPFRPGAGYRETVHSIREALKEVGLRGWLAKDLTLEPQLWDNVQAFLVGCKAGIGIFTHDDVRATRPVAKASVFNPNVSIEVGYMLSRRKPVLLLKEQNLERLPTDMVGFLFSDFDLENAAETIRSAVHTWVKNDL